MKTTHSLNARKAELANRKGPARQIRFAGKQPHPFHRITALLLIGCLLGTMSPVPLLAQQQYQPKREVARIEPLAIAPDRPLSLPPAGPLPDAKLLADQEAMLAKAASSLGAIEVRPTEPREPQQPLPVFPKFSDPPTDAEIAMIQLFDSPPVPFGVEKPGENAAFVRALETGREAGWKRGGLTVLEEYLSGHKASRWEVALRHEIARIRLRDGFFTRATAALERAWEGARSAKENPQRHIADRIAAELAELYAQTGAKAQLTALIEATKDRELAAETGDRVRHARMRFGAEVTRGRGGSGTCGASALTGLLAQVRPNAPEPPILKDNDKLLQLDLVPGPEGHSLRQLAALADAAGFPMRAIRRDAPEAPTAAAKARPATDWPVPAIIHWTRGHYSALIRRAGSQYLLRDLSLGGDRYISAEALREETSGFLLVEDKPLPKGWKDAAPAEAGKVFGAQEFETYYYNPENPGCPPESGTGGCKPCGGMPVFDFALYKASLRIVDTPVSYSPARGPVMDFTVSYNHLDPHDASTQPYSNFGPNWSWSGLSYVERDQSNPADALIYQPGGVIERYEDVFSPAPVNYAYRYPLDETDYSESGDIGITTFTPTANFYTHAILNRTQAPAHGPAIGQDWPPLGQGTENVVPLLELLLPQSAYLVAPSSYYRWNRQEKFERVERHGTRELYDFKVGNRYLLTQRIFPDGAIVQYHYDPATARLTGITDADGVQTIITHHPTKTRLITGITVKFNPGLPALDRSAIFEYDAAGRLSAITDAVGMRSTFEYLNSSTFIGRMSTPYGDTTFTTSHPAPGVRVLEAIDPMGGRQRLELRLGDAKTYFWDKRAMRDAPPGSPLHATSAHVYQWASDSSSGFALRPIFITEKHPLENEITYTYAGQPPASPSVAGTQSGPATVTRLVPDPANPPAEIAQTTQYEYDNLGQATKVTDPKGRITEYAYNGDHLTSVRQFKGGASYDVLAQYQNYHAVSHQPQQVIDAAGKSTAYAYDALGRLRTVTQQRIVNGQTVNEMTIHAYHATSGRLIRTTGPLNAITLYTYDTVGRVASVTNPDGYRLTYL